MPQNFLGINGLASLTLFTALFTTAAANGAQVLSNTRTGLAKEFGKSFRITESEHWIIVTDTSPRRTAEIKRLLERSHDVFYKEWGQLGATKLKHKLVCLAFRTRAGLDQYRSRLGRRTPNDPGFYSTDTNRIVICDEDRFGSASSGSARRGAFGAGDAQLHSRTAHEAIHQLAFNANVHDRQRPCPAWFAEGLASNYEPVSTSGSFGLRSRHPRNRLDALQAAQRSGKLLPLRELVAIRHGAESSRYGHIIYSQGAALCRFLYARTPGGFATYKRQLSGLRIYHPSKTSLRTAFEAAFGSLEELQLAWDRFLENPDQIPPRATGRSLAGSTPPRTEGSAEPPPAPKTRPVRRGLFQRLR